MYDELSPWLGPIVTLTSSTGFLSFLVPSSFSSQTAFREAAYDSLFFIFHSIIFTCLKKVSQVKAGVTILSIFFPPPTNKTKIEQKYELFSLWLLQEHFWYRSSRDGTGGVVRACVLIILNIWKVENNPGERRQRERWAILDSSIWHSAQFFYFFNGARSTQRLRWYLLFFFTYDAITWIVKKEQIKRGRLSPLLKLHASLTDWNKRNSMEKTFWSMDCQLYVYTFRDQSRSSRFFFYLMIKPGQERKK